MKLLNIAFLAVLGLTYASIDAMEGQPPRQNLPPCDIRAVASPNIRSFITYWGNDNVPIFENEIVNEIEYDRKAAEKAAIEQRQAALKERQDALKERRFLASGTLKSLQQRSANVQIESLLQNLDDVENLQETINSYPLAIKTLLLDQIEAQKDLLDIDDAEELKKIEELNLLETLVNQALEKEPKEIKKDSPEKEEKLD